MERRHPDGKKWNAVILTARLHKQSNQVLLNSKFNLRSCQQNSEFQSIKMKIRRRLARMQRIGADKLKEISVKASNQRLSASNFLD
jgi:hypothetical protein